MTMSFVNYQWILFVSIRYYTTVLQIYIEK